MNTKERIINSLNYVQPGKVVIDIGASGQTNITIEKLSKVVVLLLLCLLVLFACDSPHNKIELISNPICDSYLADPSIVKLNDTYFIYATIDSWGGDSLAVIYSKDFKNWESTRLNWPTKKVCTSPTSKGAMVWAPSVIQAKNGNYYLYVSVGNEVWVGQSKHPLGPWKNAKADNSPLIKENAFPGFHMIDAEAFIDEDGQAYLYWGSGWGWVNGRCFVVKLKEDMVTFNGEPKNITPPNYFEAPFMLKRNGKYYLMYSDGICHNSTYKVHYSVGDTPYGPWTEGINSPVLSTSSDSITIGPGHHTVFTENRQDYILYHRIYKSNEDGLFRQLCIDSLNFDPGGNIKKVNPSGVESFIN
jgi:beta-xylosidase